MLPQLDLIKVNYIIDLLEPKNDAVKQQNINIIILHPRI